MSSELCRAYERLGHLVIVDAAGEEHRLDAAQRDRYVATLFATAPIKGNKDCKVRYTDIRRDLDLPSRSKFKGVSAEEEKGELFVPKAWRSLRKSGLPEELLGRMLSDRVLGDDVCEALTYASTEESLLNRLGETDLSEAEARLVAESVPFAGRLFKGYGSRSRKALDLLLEAFEEDEVLTLTDAEDASGLLELRLAGSGRARTKLLPPYVAYDPTCNNPVVLRAMSRMRRIVNAIIRIHGVPDEIHIELGRELKQSKREKGLIARRNRENRANNERWAGLAAGILGIEPAEVPGKVLRKLALREEQGEKDVYTGEAIDLHRLVTDDRYCEIDHVLPYSRTCDDSRANKVLVLEASNRNKRERTPWEWMSSGEAGAPDWDEYRARVSALVRNPRKRANLLNTTLAPGQDSDFIARNLNDTRYMARAVKGYLEDCLEFPTGDGRVRRVTTVQGGATATLRWVWGLNLGDHNSKDRSDDRHHAVDAAVIAACDDATIRKVADARKVGPETFKHLRKSRLADTQPWETFATDVLELREHVVPTRMVSHGVTGRAFEDTLYHLEGYTDDKGAYPLVRAKDKTSKKGNVRVNDDGSARLVDGIAFLRLWLDETARPKGKVKGKWYAEPVYYADIPDMLAGAYVPRACTIRVARVAWNPVPDTALSSDPVILFPGDVLRVGNHIARYVSMGITNCNLELKNILSNERITDFPSFDSWGKNTEVEVIEQDCLGHSFGKYVLNLDDSTFELRGEDK